MDKSDNSVIFCGYDLKQALNELAFCHYPVKVAADSERGEFASFDEAADFFRGKEGAEFRISADGQ